MWSHIHVFVRRPCHAHERYCRHSTGGANRNAGHTADHWMPINSDDLELMDMQVEGPYRLHDQLRTLPMPSTTFMGVRRDQPRAGSGATGRLRHDSTEPCQGVEALTRW